MFMISSLRLAFKPRPKDVIPWAVDDKYKPQLNQSYVPDNEGEIEGHPFKFNQLTGFPELIAAHMPKMMDNMAGTPMTFADHAYDRISDRTIDTSSVPTQFPGSKDGFKPVEVEVGKTPKGSAITKFLLRGPMTPKKDVTLPIDVSNPRRPHVRSVLDTDVNDHHNSLDLRRVHLPEEFAHGKAPTRRLISDKEAKEPGYQRIPHTNMKVRQEIIRKHGIQ